MKLKFMWVLLPVCLVLVGCEKSTTTTTTDGTNINVTISTNRVEVNAPPAIATNIPALTNK
jgi:hypothetical protein